MCHVPLTCQYDGKILSLHIKLLVFSQRWYHMQLALSVVRGKDLLSEFVQCYLLW